MVSKNNLPTIFEVRGDVSSQYISALMMIAPSLPQGLKLELTGKIGSRPYIDMTRAVMEKFGVSASLGIIKYTIHCPLRNTVLFHMKLNPTGRQPATGIVYQRFPDKEVFLERVIDKSIQGDRKMADIMEHLGVTTEFQTWRHTANDLRACRGIVESILVIVRILLRPLQ